MYKIMKQIFKFSIKNCDASNDLNQIKKVKFSYQDLKNGEVV